MSSASLPSEDAPNILDAALSLARRGFAVFPCHTVRAGSCSCGKANCDSHGKHPATPHGLKDATKHEAEIRRLWSAECTDANIGIATGAPSGGIFAVDCDTKPGEDGRASLAALEAKHGSLPSTLTARTGSGGLHKFFRYLGTKIPNSIKKLGPGIDIRGDGGYVIAPPSMHKSGAPYAWIDDREPVDAPEWLVDAARRRPLRMPTAQRSSVVIPSSGVASSAGGPTTMSIVERARQYVRKMEPAISGAGGHNACFDAALALVGGFDLPAHIALDILQSEFNPRCQPLWSEEELRHKIESADKSERAARGRGWLLNAPRSGQGVNGPSVVSARAYATLHASETADAAEERAAIQSEERVDTTTMQPTRSDTSSAADRLAADGAALIAEAEAIPSTRASTPTSRLLVRVPMTEWIRRARGMKHLPCGFPTIDLATRGGFIGGRLYFWIGQPGAAKTTTLCTLAANYARAGFAVAILAADEPASGLATRFGQMLGFNRGDIEEGEPCTLDALQAAIDRELSTLHLIDAVEEEATIEDAVEELARDAGARGVPGIFIVDSLQEARSRASLPGKNRRDETDAKLAVLKAAAKTSGLMVHVTSEMARSGYGRSNPNDRTDDIATGKESGGIEYAADMIFTLRPAQAEAGIVDVTMPKNRLGAEKPDLRLRIDFARATVTETERPKDDTANLVVIQKLKSLLEGKTGRFQNHDQIRAALGVHKRLVGSVLKELGERCEVLKYKGFYRLSSDVAEPAEPVPEPASAPGSRFPLRSRGTKGTRARRAGHTPRRRGQPTE